jgi:segregation and condensation protein B
VRVSNEPQTESDVIDVDASTRPILSVQALAEPDVIAQPVINIEQAKLVLETALLTSKEAMAVDALVRLFDPPLPADTVRALVEELRSQWLNRGVELVLVATGYRFQAKTEMQVYIDRLEPDKAPRYSRSIMETLAIIAYRQPTTRGEIEAIRGVAVSSHVIKALEDREWIEVIGHKESPGRPALYATTKRFLNDLGLRSLSELPALADLDEHPALDVPGVPLEPPFPQQARLDTERDLGQTLLEIPLPTHAPPSAHPEQPTTAPGSAQPITHSEHEQRDDGPRES